MGFFGRNLVAQYPYERSVVDGVNVGFEVFRIRTEIGERGATVKAGYDLPIRDRRTRAERYETLTEDLTYQPSDLDHTVIAPNQIRTVIEAYRDSLFTELFPRPARGAEDACLPPRTTITPRRSSASCATSSARATTSPRRSRIALTAAIPSF